MQSLAEIDALYHRAYYLTDCDGHAEFRRSGGARLPRRLRKCLRLAPVKPGDRVLDLGCGRAELAWALSEAGAQVIAVDPARAALELAATTGGTESAGAAAPQEHVATTRGPARRVSLIRGRGEALPLCTGWADRILLVDVVEHLRPDALARVLAECRRVLAPSGRLVVHTQPNRRLLDWTIPALAPWCRLWGVRLPRDLRSELTPGAGPAYHVNELTRGALARALRHAGFRIDELWLEGSYPVHRIFGEARIKPLLLRWFRRSKLLREFLASQIYAIASAAHPM